MAVAIVADEQDVYPPRVLVSVTGLTLGNAVELFRVVGGVRTPLRAGADASVTDTSFLRTDAEQPFGVPVSYLAVVNGSDEYVTSATTYTLAGGLPVLTDAISGLAAEAQILAWDEKRYTRRSTTFRVGGRNIVVSDDFGQYEGSVEFVTATTSQRDNLMETLTDATEGVVQIRQPGGYDGVDSYIAVTGVSERRFSQDGSDERRRITVDAVEVDGWAPALEARGFTLQDIADFYSTPTLLNANPYFEADASDWSVIIGGSFARSTAQFHTGVASGLLTPSGSAGTVNVASAALAPASAGLLYRVSGWLRCAAARTVTLQARYYTAADVFISTTDVNIAVAANTWTYFEGEGVAPATTGGVRVAAQMTGTPPGTALLYLDEVKIEAVPSMQDFANDFPTMLDVAQADWS
ncbi:hypothetical protein ACFWC6_33155 [Micromonospora chalcea]